MRSWNCSRKFPWKKEMTVSVMIEGKVSGESAYIGRTYGDAPKVDGYMFVQTGELLVTGDFAKVKVTGAMEYDLIGELADEYTE